MLRFDPSLSVQKPPSVCVSPLTLPLSLLSQQKSVLLHSVCQQFPNYSKVLLLLLLHLLVSLYFNCFAALSWTRRPICWTGFVLPSGILALMSHNIHWRSLFWSLQALCSPSQKWCYRKEAEVRGALVKVLSDQEAGFNEAPICTKVTHLDLFSAVLCIFISGEAFIIHHLAAYSTCTSWEHQRWVWIDEKMKPSWISSFLSVILLNSLKYRWFFFLYCCWDVVVWLMNNYSNES